MKTFITLICILISTNSLSLHQCSHLLEKCARIDKKYVIPCLVAATGIITASTIYSSYCMNKKQTISESDLLKTAQLIKNNKIEIMIHPHNKPNQPTIVMFHGLAEPKNIHGMASLTYYNRVCKKNEPSINQNVIIPDMPYSSREKGPVTFGGSSDIITALLVLKTLPSNNKFLFYGYSYGAAVAINTAHILKNHSNYKNIFLTLGIYNPDKLAQSLKACVLDRPFISIQDSLFCEVKFGFSILYPFALPLVHFYLRFCSEYCNNKAIHLSNKYNIDQNRINKILIPVLLITQKDDNEDRLDKSLFTSKQNGNIQLLKTELNHRDQLDDSNVAQIQSFIAQHLDIESKKSKKNK